MADHRPPVRPAASPMIFSGPMIRALIRETQAPGTGKTMARQVVSPGTCKVLGSRVTAKSPAWAGLKFGRAEARTRCPLTGVARPHLGVPWVHPEDEANGMEADAIYRVDPIWSVGDRIWVKEGFHATDGYSRPVEGPCAHLFGYQVRGENREFVVDGIGRVREFSYHLNGWGGRNSANRSPIFMPRWMSRLTLTVTEVRVERLQEITEADAVAEGLLPDTCGGQRMWDPGPPHGLFGDPRVAFRFLWTSLHGPVAWAANPWVVVLRFVPALANIDAPPPSG